MNLIIYSSRRGDARRISLLRPVPMLALALVSSIVFTGGYLLASVTLDGAAPSVVEELKDRIATQDEHLASASRESQEQLDALTARIGQLNAHILRIDALGRRLVSMADMDDGEFNFDEPPARGGPDSGDLGASAKSDEIAGMLQASIEHARDDMDARRLVEERVEAQRVIEALHAALAGDGDELLSADERVGLEQALQDLTRLAAESQDPREVEAAIVQLEKDCEFYVERRMNSGIRKAMAGHRVDEFVQEDGREVD